jgi:hypothetical protein
MLLGLVFLAPSFLAGQTALTVPFQQHVSVTAAIGAGGTFGTVSVPLGYRLVIEYVSASGSAPTGEKVMLSVQTTVNGDTATYYIPTQVQVSAEGRDTFIGNQMMKIYAESPQVYVQCLRVKPDGTFVQVSFNISGYLIPI